MRNGRASSFAIIVVVIVLLLAAPLAYVWLSAPRVPQVVLPDPNGYELLLQAGSKVANPAVDVGQADSETLRQFVELNANVLEASRKALQIECAVPIEYTAAYQQRVLDEVSPLKQVARLLWADARLTELDGDPAAAAVKYAALVNFNDKVATGGLLVHLQLGMAYQHLAWKALLQLVPSMTATQRAVLRQRLEMIRFPSKDLSDYRLRERALYSTAYGWYLTLMSSRAPNANAAEEATIERIAEIEAVRDQVMKTLGEP